MDFLIGLVLGVIVAALARIVRAELLLPQVLADLTAAVQTLHGTARHLQTALEQLCDEWLDQQTQVIADQKRHTMKGNKNGSKTSP